VSTYKGMSDTLAATAAAVAAAVALSFYLRT
jgi:hypothetical protein